MTWCRDVADVVPGTVDVVPGTVFRHSAALRLNPAPPARLPSLRRRSAMAEAAEITVSLVGGRRVDARVGEHVVRTDQPTANGGEDSAPSPFQLFLASVGTCAGIFVQGFCAKRGIPYDRIRIIERPSYDEGGTLRAVDLTVELPPDFPEKYREAVLRAIDGCSVKKAVQAQPEFRVRTAT
jgi:ribosomal protein S12 methylthiotransferase accessory factor